MTKNSCFLILAAVICAVACPLAASADSPTTDQKTNYVSIETPAGGQPMLVVRYPWTVHKNPSIEIRAYVKDEEDSVRVRPLYFRRHFMKDDVTVAVYQCQAAADATRTLVNFTRNEIDFVGVGDRNLLDRPSICITCTTVVVKPNQDMFPERARRAIYPLLEPWSPDDKTLFLSLPENLFTDPAKIRVFLLREDRPVWSEIKEWPGLKKPEK